MALLTPKVEIATAKARAVPKATRAVEGVVRLSPEALALVGALVVEIAALAVVVAIAKATRTVQSATYAPLRHGHPRFQVSPGPASRTSTELKRTSAMRAAAARVRTKIRTTKEGLFIA
jgi:hypothetical protein